jgi:hypothetical protein
VGERVNDEEGMMLLNDLPEDKKLAYLLGGQVERYEFGGNVRLLSIRVVVTIGIGLLLLSLWLISGFQWR